MSDYEMKLMDLDVEQLGIPVSSHRFLVLGRHSALVYDLFLFMFTGAGVQLRGQDAVRGVCTHLP